jgi:hypothetical protein
MTWDEAPTFVAIRRSATRGLVGSSLHPEILIDFAVAVLI